LGFFFSELPVYNDLFNVKFLEELVFVRQVEREAQLISFVECFKHAVLDGAEEVVAWGKMAEQSLFLSQRLMKTFLDAISYQTFIPGEF